MPTNATIEVSRPTDAELLKAQNKGGKWTARRADPGSNPVQYTYLELTPEEIERSRELREKKSQTDRDADIERQDAFLRRAAMVSLSKDSPDKFDNDLALFVCQKLVKDQRKETKFSKDADDASYQIFAQKMRFLAENAENTFEKLRTACIEVFKDAAIAAEVPTSVCRGMDTSLGMMRILGWSIGATEALQTVKSSAAQLVRDRLESGHNDKAENPTR